MKKILKGIITSILLSQIIFLMIPFNIHADTQIVPTYSSSAQTWVNTNGQINVTNYCQGTSSSTNSCKLSFTLPSNWYGMLYIDGYTSSNTQWINYQNVFIADGYGEFNYNYWSNGGQQVISKVTIQIINVVKPDSNVDLSQIISLLTAIENDTSAIDVTLDNTLSQITNVLNQLITSNGYLNSINQMRMWDVPVESYNYVYYALNNWNRYEYTAFLRDHLNYPSFYITQNTNLIPADGVWSEIYVIFATNRWYDMTEFPKQFTYNYTLSSVERIYSGELKIYKIKFTNPSNLVISIKYSASSNMMIIPIYYGYNLTNASTDFAIRYGFSNQLLNNLNIIANGTSGSNSASQNLESSNNQMSSDMNDLATIESGYNQQFNNSLNDIDFTNPIQSNAGILPAANFVITVFNGLVNNPLSILIIIICILTIGKKVIGK